MTDFIPDFALVLAGGLAVRYMGVRLPPYVPLL